MISNEFYNVQMQIANLDQIFITCRTIVFGMAGFLMGLLIFMRKKKILSPVNLLKFAIISICLIIGIGFYFDVLSQKSYSDLEKANTNADFFCKENLPFDCLKKTRISDWIMCRIYYVCGMCIWAYCTIQHTVDFDEKIKIP